MNYLVIKNSSEMKRIKDYSLFFVDTELDSILFEQLLDLYMQNEIKVYKRINNRYAEKLIEDERQQISNGDTTNMEHYNKVDFLKNQYNQYLGLQNYNKDDSEELLINFRQSKLKHYNLLLEKNKRLVIEVYREVNEQLESDIKLFHHTVDAIYLAFTNDPSMYFKYSEELEDKDELISKSNRNAKNIYFLIPHSNQYKLAKKMIYINTIDYKASYEAIRNKDCITILNDDLKANQYIINQCKENRITTQLDFELKPLKFVKQDVNLLLIIMMTETYGKVDLYEYDGENIKLIKKLQKNAYQYQKMILSYKNDLYYNYQKDFISQAIKLNA